MASDMGDGPFEEGSTGEPWGETARLVAPYFLAYK